MVTIQTISHGVSKEAIIGVEFRSISPASQEGYAASQSKDELPQVYHYYTRDSRRGVEAPAVTLNTTGTTALPAGGSSAVMVSKTIVRPPAPNNRRLEPAPSQPDSEGYFPIQNFK